MNCKKGDLAVHVSADKKSNIGAIVVCEKYYGFIDGSHCWETTGDHRLSRDEHLRPLRDSDRQDETLTWAPVPKKVEA